MFKSEPGVSTSPVSCTVGVKLITDLEFGICLQHLKENNVKTSDIFCKCLHVNDTYKVCVCVCLYNYVLSDLMSSNDVMDIF